MMIRRLVFFTLFAFGAVLPAPATAQQQTAEDSGAPSWVLTGNGDADKGKSQPYQPPPRDNFLAQGLEAFNKKDYAAAQRLFFRASYEKNPEALYMLGYMAQNALGDHARPNFVEAVKHYRSAADLGNLKAATALGYIFSKGLGNVSPNYEEAVKWYSTAARQGDRIAQNYLGEMLQDGRGWEKDEKLAAKWFYQSAEQGLPEGQYNLALTYLSGRGITKNGAEAAKWLEAAARQGVTAAQYRLGLLYAEGRDVPQDFSRAAQWFEVAAMRGHARAQYNLAELYKNGQGVPVDLVTAGRLYLTAAEQGYVPAQFALGILYELGGDYKSALDWYLKSAEEGDHPQAPYRIALLYERGLDGKKPDYAEAVTWYTRAARAGNAEAQNRLGYLYREGKGVEQDYAEAFVWFALAAMQANSDDIRDQSIISRIGVGHLMRRDEREKAQVTVKQRLASVGQPETGADTPRPKEGSAYPPAAMRYFEMMAEKEKSKK